MISNGALPVMEAWLGLAGRVWYGEFTRLAVPVLSGGLDGNLCSACGCALHRMVNN